MKTNAVFKRYSGVAEAISLLLYPHAEVVLHDLATGLIKEIHNGFSKRKAGDESLLEESSDHDEFPNVFPVYLKTNWDGRKIKSVSATIRDDQGKAVGLLCINLDLSKWDDLHQFLEQWLNNVGSRPAALFKDDWREKINAFVTNYLNRENSTLKHLSKDKKRELVLALHKEGAFNAKNAAHYIADVLELSRATIYNYLK